MSHQDRKIVVNHRTIKQVVDWLLAPALFASMKARKGASWKPRMLAVAALLWAISGDGNLKDRFEQARKIVRKVFHWQLPPGATYQGFVKMLRKWHVELQLVIVPHVRVQMREVLPGQWEIAGYVVFAGDGSRIELPRPESLEEAYSPQRKKNQNKQQRTSKRGRKAKTSAERKAAKVQRAKKQSAESIAKKGNSPQMWLTLLWHVGSGLPWAWRSGPSDSGRDIEG